MAWNAQLKGNFSEDSSINNPRLLSKANLRWGQRKERRQRKANVLDVPVLLMRWGVRGISEGATRDRLVQGEPQQLYTYTENRNHT
ncbi:hypothetical protein, partial [Pseudomonas syringae]